MKHETDPQYEDQVELTDIQTEDEGDETNNMGIRLHKSPKWPNKSDAARTLLSDDDNAGGGKDEMKINHFLNIDIEPSPEGNDLKSPEASTLPSNHNQDDQVDNTYYSYIIPIFVPALLNYTIEAILIPVIPVFVVKTLQRTSTDAGFAASLTSLSRLFMNIPAGYLISRMGHRYALTVAAVLCAVPSFMVGIWPTYTVLLVTRVVFAAGAALFNVGRQALVSDYVPMEKRGQTMAIMGGMMRIGYAISPLAGGWIARSTPAGVFYVQGALATILAIWTLFSTPSSRAKQHLHQQGYVYVLTQYWRPLLTFGFFVILLQMIRTGVLLITPLKGISIGLLSDKIGIVMSVTAASGVLVFMLGGYISDRWGRKKVAVPGVLGLALSAGLIALSTNFGLLLATSLCGGLANGFNSGIVLTFGADLAPPEARGTFLGLYSMAGDIGQTLGPLVAGYLSDAMRSLPNVGFIYASLGCIAALWMIFVCPETKNSRAS